MRFGLKSSRTGQPKGGAEVSKPSDLIVGKRVSAAERLWSVVLQLREELSLAVFFFTILMPSEYDSALGDDGKMHDVVSSITDEKVGAAMNRASQVEHDRLYLGEQSWSQFFIYRAFLGRVATLIIMGKRRGHIESWRSDNGVGQILRTAFRQEDLERILGRDNDLHAMDRILGHLQSMMLKEIERITSGA